MVDIPAPSFPEPSGGATGAQAITRALLVLRILATGQSSGLGLQDITNATGLARPTVHRILKTLVAEGLAEQHPRSRRYAIGEQISLLALARSKPPALLDAAQAQIDNIAREIGDTAFLTVRIGDETLCLARRMGGYPIQVLVIEVGARRPLGVSSAGIVMLAQMARAQAAEIVARNAPRFARYRTDAAQVADWVAHARGRDHFVWESRLVPGTKALSVPIVKGGLPIGALTIAAVRQRLRPQRVEEIAALLQAYSLKVANQLH